MTIFEENKYRNFVVIRADLERYFQDIPVDCPYGLPFTAVYRQAPCTSIPDPLMELFLDGGYRRNGNYLYTMACPDCRSCISIRLDPREFEASRNQKRTLYRNKDILVEVGSVEISEEKLELCGKFLEKRYPGKGNSAVDYYGSFFANCITQSYEFRYRKPDGSLLGIAIVDLGKNWLNAVYFFFDPDDGKRSPGTYNILQLIHFCRKNNINSFFLGYWIKEVKSMDYKINFRPHYLFINNLWEKSRIG